MADPFMHETNIDWSTYQARRRRWLQAIAGAAALPFGAGLRRQALAAPAQLAVSRCALVIGNAAYRRAPLKNPVNDARLFARMLTDTGFHVVLIENGSMTRIIDGMREWLGTAAAAQSRVFYFAGHGLQFRNRNFLVPVDSEISSEEDIPRKTIDAVEFIERLSRFDRGVNLAILDACRNTPFPQLAGGLRGRGGETPTPAGLAPVAAPRGTLVAYSTSPGAVAMDGSSGSNSVYTKHLVAEMQAEDVPIESVFKRVRSAVMAETQNIQVPWETSSLVGDFCLRASNGSRCTEGAVAPAQVMVPTQADPRSVDLKSMQRRP